MLGGTAVLGLAGQLRATPAIPRVLAWQGRARVEADGRTLDLAIDSRVEPFRRARSRSWIIADGEATARTLVIEPDTGWLEQASGRKPLPRALVAHERQQYGLYGYLLRALRSPGGPASLRLSQAGYPDAVFRFEGGRPASADYTVLAPEPGAAPIAQRVRFAGPTLSGALRWPGRISVEQGGRPYFALTIDRFEALA